MKKTLSLLALVLLLTNCKKTADELLFLEVNKFLGTYEGTWSAPQVNTTGGAKVILTAEKSTRTVGMTIDFDGDFFGLGDLPAQTLTGTYSTGAANLKGKNNLLGDYDIQISKDGDVSGAMKELVTGLFPEMTLTGKVTSENVNMASVLTTRSGAKTDVVLVLKKK